MSRADSSKKDKNSQSCRDHDNLKENETPMVSLGTGSKSRTKFADFRQGRNQSLKPLY